MVKEIVEGKETQAEETLSAEQRIKALEQAKAESDAKATEKEKGFKTLQQQFNEVSRELQRAKRVLDDREFDREYQKALAAIIAETKGQSEEEFDSTVKAKKGDLTKLFDDRISEIEKKREASRRQAEFEEKITSYQKKVEAAGLTEEDDEYWDIRDCVLRRQYQRADNKLRKLAVKKETPKEEEIQKMVDERAKEKALEILKEKDVLTQETGGPTGASDVPIKIGDFRKASDEARTPQELLDRYKKK